MVNAFFELLKKKHDNNHRSILGYELGMLLNCKKKTNQDEVKILSMLPDLCNAKIRFPVAKSKALVPNRNLSERMDDPHL